MISPTVEQGSDEEKSEVRQKPAAYIIDSDSPYKLLWNMFTNIFYMVSFFMYPLIISFEFQAFERFRLFELFLDFIMLCDIATEFVTTRNQNGKTINKFNQIASAYIKSTFFFDILACLPGLIALESSSAFYYFKIFRYL